MSQLTAEQSLAIIKSFSLIKETGVPYKGIWVSNVSFADSLGQPFTYPTGEEYAIVNFKAITPYGLTAAVADYKDGDFQSACNHNMSMRMSHKEASLIDKTTVGTLICRDIALKNEDGELTGETAMFPYKFAAARAQVAGVIDFEAMLAMDIPVNANA